MMCQFLKFVIIVVGLILNCRGPFGNKEIIFLKKINPQDFVYECHLDEAFLCEWVSWLWQQCFIKSIFIFIFLFKKSI